MQTDSRQERRAPALLTPAQGAQLVDIAKEALRQFYAKGWWEIAPPADEALHRRYGAFVTLRRQGTLRGCIGQVEPIDPVWRATADMAIAAATRDPRFDPVRAEELPELDVSVTVLGPPEPIEDPFDFEIGTHGLIASRGAHHGLLLPQVAVEYGWDKPTFLSQTCIKAGLPPDAWQRGDVRLARFAGQVFGESA